MTSNEMDLGWLLGHIPVDDFFRRVWEQEPLVLSRGEPEYYRGLLTRADLDQVIAFSRPKFFNPGDFRPEGPRARPFVQGWLADDEPAPAVLYPSVSEVHEAFLRGKTVILNATEQRWRPAALLCRHLEMTLGCPVHANVYVTPPGAQGFHAHFDGHEVFVLQLDGTKHWRLYGFGREMPLPDEDGPVPPESLGSPTREFVLRPGDLLYLPRGLVHEAFTSDRLSMHLTLGAKVFRISDLVRRAIDIASREDSRFRRSVPLGMLPAGRTTPVIEEAVRALFEHLAARAVTERAVDRLATEFVRGLAPLPADTFGASAEADRVVPDSPVERVEGMLFRLSETADRVVLEFPGSCIDGPPKVRAALRFVAATTRFTARELPDDLSIEGRLTLVRRLLRARFLRPCVREESAGPPGRSAPDAEANQGLGPQGNGSDGARIVSNNL